LEQETGGRVSTILQLRKIPALIERREAFLKSPGKRHSIKLTYVTPRGRWYQYSWKGIPEKSGGLATNIGIHMFDLLLWMFGPASSFEVHLSDDQRISGCLQLERADVSWFLSIDGADVQPADPAARARSLRSIEIDGELLEFSDVFGELHTEVYRDILAGKGPDIATARASIELCYAIRNTTPKQKGEGIHPSALPYLKK